jgi:hypothetical protein
MNQAALNQKWVRGSISKAWGQAFIEWLPKQHKENIW